jgi:hypothetical protein
MKAKAVIVICDRVMDPRLCTHPEAQQATGFAKGVGIALHEIEPEFVVFTGAGRRLGAWKKETNAAMTARCTDIPEETSWNLEQEERSFPDRIRRSLELIGDRLGSKTTVEYTILYEPRPATAFKTWLFGRTIPDASVQLISIRPNRHRPLECAAA